MFSQKTIGGRGRELSAHSTGEKSNPKEMTKEM